MPSKSKLTARHPQPTKPTARSGSGAKSRPTSAPRSTPKPKPRSKAPVEEVGEEELELGLEEGEPSNETLPLDGSSVGLSEDEFNLAGEGLTSESEGEQTEEEEDEPSQDQEAMLREYQRLIEAAKARKEREVRVEGERNQAKWDKMCAETEKKADAAIKHELQKMDEESVGLAKGRASETVFDLEPIREMIQDQTRYVNKLSNDFARVRKSLAAATPELSDALERRKRRADEATLDIERNVRQQATVESSQAKRLLPNAAKAQEDLINYLLKL